MIDLSKMNLEERLYWGYKNLIPVKPKYCIIYEDPAYPDNTAVILVPAPEWLASALYGGIVPEINRHLKLKTELTTDKNETIICDLDEVDDIFLKHKIVDNKIINYNSYMYDTSMPSMPAMTEEEAMEYLLMKDIPKRVWHPDYKHNRKMFKICKYENRHLGNTAYRDSWKMDDNIEYYEKDIPTRFSEYWDLKNQILTINMDKAKEIHKQRLRKAREKVFEKLDVEFMLALERENSENLSQIKKDKQFLRDITKLPEIENAKTLEELEKIWPDILNK